MSLIKRWGLGVDLVFEARDAVVNMTRTHQATARLQNEFRRTGDAAGAFAGRLGQLAMVLTPIALAFGAAVGKGSALAADLEAQALTMRVLIGDAGKAAELIDLIRQRAAATSFQEGDLIEGSKRLLRLTKDNVGANLELLDVAMTMAALNPTKGVTDAVEAMLDAASGGGFERMKEFGLAFRAEDFAAAGRPGGEAWGRAVMEALTAQVQRMTRGEDLVGALSSTFTGRLSTLKDAITNGLRTFGQVVNAEAGPMLAPLTDRLLGLTPAIRAGALRLAAGIRQVLATAEPMIARFLGWWDRLGEEGQARIVATIMSVGALASVLVPLGGALGGVAFAVTAMVGALAAAWPVISGAGGVLLAFLSPAVLLPLAAGLALLTASLVAFYAAMKDPDEGPLQFLVRLGLAVRDVLVSGLADARVAWSAFAEGFRAEFMGLGGAMMQLEQAFGPIGRKLREFMDMVGGDPVAIQFWKLLGGAIGVIGNFLLAKMVAGLDLVATMIDVVVAAWRPMALALDSFAGGLLGLVTGSMSAEDAILAMVNGVGGALVGLVNAVFQLLAGTAEGLLRAIVLSVAGLPGMAGLMERFGREGASGISAARQAFERDTARAIAGIDGAEGRRNRAGAAAAAPVVNVSPQVENKLQVSTSVQVDGREIARAHGAAQVRAGQREGQAMPAESRGRVMRGGVLRPVAPTEVW